MVSFAHFANSKYIFALSFGRMFFLDCLTTASLLISVSNAATFFWDLLSLVDEISSLGRLAFVLNWRSSQNKQFQNGNFGKKTISIQALLLSVHQFGHGLSAKVSRFGWNIPFISSCIWLKKQVKHGGNGVKKFAISCFLSNCFSPFETLNTGMY